VDTFVGESRRERRHALGVRPARRIAALAALVALLAGCGASPSATPAARADDERVTALRAAVALPSCPSGLGQSLPDLTLPCLTDGSDARIDQPGPGMPMLVNVWGTWCPPCVREVPLLVDLVEQAQGALTVVGVLTQDTPVNGLEFARQFGVNYTSVLDDDGTVMRAYSPGPPVTLFLSADGQVRHVKRGEFTDATELRTLLQQHLGVALPVPP
jgi:thiol-disulfide isomerase/thioredoxin